MKKFQWWKVKVCNIALNVDGRKQSVKGRNGFNDIDRIIKCYFHIYGHTSMKKAEIEVNFIYCFRMLSKFPFEYSKIIIKCMILTDMKVKFKVIKQLASYVYYFGNFTDQPLHKFYGISCILNPFLSSTKHK